MRFVNLFWPTLRVTRILFLLIPAALATFRPLGVGQVVYWTTHPQGRRRNAYGK